MRTIEGCINDLVCDIENFIGGNITERQNELLNEILEIHKAEKRQKGKWILSGGKYRCSECGEKAKHIFDKSKGGYDEYEPFRSDFCPFCGTDMRESEVE